MPKNGELVLIPADELGGECDWGDCDKPAIYYRYDEWGHGWLPCCGDCAKKPILEV